jgi:hypothetical protein
MLQQLGSVEQVRSRVAAGRVGNSAGVCVWLVSSEAAAGGRQLQYMRAEQAYYFMHA